MNISFGDRIRKAWNVFTNRNQNEFNKYGTPYVYRPDKYRFFISNERSIINAIYNRIAIDAASIDIKHVKTDGQDRFTGVVNDKLNQCFNVEANIDQTGRAFRQDIYMSLFDNGTVAIIPTDMDVDESSGTVTDILKMRVGKILEWYPEYVKVNVYNEQSGKREDIVLKKSMVAIIENPLYSIMNEPNSVLQRLIRKLNMLDVIDEQSSSGKLDLIIQLPYVTKTSRQSEQAELRRKAIERQLTGSKYGIAYIDGTEKITQLNRPINNNLMSQIEYLTSMLYNQLGITDEILNGTANEQTMLNYYTRTIDAIVSSVTDSIKRSFLTKTARSQGHSIMSFRNPFKLIPVSALSEVAERFTRNEILSSNDIRQIIGYIPSSNPRADELENKNIKNQKTTNNTMYENKSEIENQNKNQNESITEVDYGT